MSNRILHLRMLLGTPYLKVRSFRSKAALEALSKASESKVVNLVLYNYPSFSGAFSALFAHLFHSRLNIPCLILPFSSVEPLRVDDLFVDGLEKCYFLDFIGPEGFAVELSRRSKCKVILFDHRKSVLRNIPSLRHSPESLMLHLDIKKSSSTAVFEYFCTKLTNMQSPDGNISSLLDKKDQDRMKMVLKYVEDGDLQRWSLPDIREFNAGLAEWRTQLNCITNPYMYEQLMGMNSVHLIAKGSSNITSHHSTVNDLLNKAFKVRLGRGLYGECLGVRVDGSSELSNDICKELSIKSAAAGLSKWEESDAGSMKGNRIFNKDIRGLHYLVEITLEEQALSERIYTERTLGDCDANHIIYSFLQDPLPIGAAIYMQRNNLKMCLRSTDNITDTSEVAKAYGGGGLASSSSFIIRMDEYNKWLSVN